MTHRLPIQHLTTAPSYWRDRLPNIAPSVGEAAWQGYAADGHGSQSCERLHERGGFDYGELGYYLARAVDEGLVEVRVLGADAAGDERPRTQVNRRVEEGPD